MGMFDKVTKKMMEAAAEAAQAAQAAAQQQAGDGATPPEPAAPPPAAVPRSGVCPECGSATVHQAPHGRFTWEEGRTGGVYVATSRMVAVSPVTTLVCVTCGHFRHFLDDPGRLAEVA
ncbi:MAG: hypothetical protein AB1416_14050, partial [Actinomycetota bacterium]